MSELFQTRPEIEPVWNRIPSFFAYPLKAAVLPVLAGFTVLYGLSGVIPGWPIQLLLVLLAWMGLYKYAYEVLANTASGDLEPPEGGYNAETDYMVFKHVGLMLIMFITTMLTAFWSGSAAVTWTVMIFFVVAWPAAIITLAMTESLLAALNPATWVSIMGRIGWPYLAASVFLFLMQQSEGIAVGLLSVFIGGMPLVMGMAGFLLGGYFLVASFHLMGYLVYQHHEELGVEVEEPLEPAGGQSEDERVVSESRALVEDGRVEEAVERLGNHLRQSGGEPALHDQYRKLLKLREDTDRLLEHGREYITLLLRSFEDRRKALRVAEECLDIDPEFRPADGSEVRELVELADHFDLDRLVVRLSNGFAKRFPKHRDIPAVHLVAARHLSEKKGKDEMALKVLKDLQARYPEHELRGEIDKQVALLEKVIGAGPQGAGGGG